MLILKWKYFSNETGDLVGIYKLNRKSGKYSAILGPGTYRIEIIDIEGYADYGENVKILGKNDQMEIQKFDIILKPE